MKFADYKKETMFLLKKEHVLKLLDNLLYFSLLGLGIYFIYIGDVIPRFWIGRTNFAEYEEVMNELPTISTYIRNVPENYTMGKDLSLVLLANSDQFANYLLCLDLLCQIKSVIFAKSICSGMD